MTTRVALRWFAAATTLVATRGQFAIPPMMQWCSQPSGTHEYSLITQGDATVCAGRVYTKAAIGGDLFDGTPDEVGLIEGHVQIGGSGTGNWTFAAGVTTNTALETLFDFSEWEELARTALPADFPDGHQVMVINSGGVFEASMLGGTNTDAGKVLVIFNTSDPVVIGYGGSGGSAKPFAATIIAPFSTVVLIGSTAGAIVAKQFQCNLQQDANSHGVQIHGNPYSGDISCRDDGTTAPPSAPTACPTASEVVSCDACSGSYGMRTVSELMLVYTGVQGSQHAQSDAEVTIAGAPPVGTATITVRQTTLQWDIRNSTAMMSFAIVEAGQELRVSQPAGFPASITITTTGPQGEVASVVRFAAGCTEPLAVGDLFGPFRVSGFKTLSGTEVVPADNCGGGTGTSTAECSAQPAVPAPSGSRCVVCPSSSIAELRLAYLGPAPASEDGGGSAVSVSVGSTSNLVLIYHDVSTNDVLHISMAEFPDGIAITLAGHGAGDPTVTTVGASCDSPIRLGDELADGMFRVTGYRTTFGVVVSNATVCEQTGTPLTSLVSTDPAGRTTGPPDSTTTSTPEPADREIPPTSPPTRPPSVRTPPLPAAPITTLGIDVAGVDGLEWFAKSPKTSDNAAGRADQPASDGKVGGKSGLDSKTGGGKSGLDSKTGSSVQDGGKKGRKEGKLTTEAKTAKSAATVAMPAMLCGAILGMVAAAVLYFKRASRSRLSIEGVDPSSGLVVNETTELLGEGAEPAAEIWYPRRTPNVLYA